MANKRLQQLEINSVDVSSYVLNWELVENWGDPIDEIKIELVRNVTDDVTLKAGQTVELWFGFTTSTDKKHFSGELIKYEPEIGIIKVTAYNKLYATVRKTISAKIYDKDVVGDPINPDGKVSDCFTDLVTTYGGLTADATSVEDTGIIPQITNFVCDQTDVKERLDKLAEIMDWIYYYRADTDKVYFHPKQFNSNSTTLTIGSNVINVPKWKYDKTDLINDLRVDGVFQEDLLEETFTGDGATDEFTLSVTPIKNITVYVNASKDYTSQSPTQSEVIVLGVENATAGSYDYKVDKSKKKILFESGSIPAGGKDNILVRYVGKKEIPIHILDDDSVLEYEEHKRVIQLKDVITVADAEIRANNVITKFKDPFQNTTLNVKHTSGYSFELGDAVSVVDSVNTPNVNGTFTIFGITYKYPNGYDEISVGDREFDPPEFFINISERLHKLERELISEGTVLTELRRATMNLTLEVDSLTILQQYINDSFVLNHTTNSLLHSTNDAKIINNFEDVTKWSDTGITTAKSTMNTTQGTDGDYLTGTGAIQFVGTVSGSFGLRNTSSIGDLSGCLGTGSGTPSEGTFGVWLNTTQIGNFTSTIQLRIGPNTSNYFVYNSQTYAQKVASTTATWNLDSGWTLLLFDANTPSTRVGTVTWTNSSYAEIKGTVSGATTFSCDYLTVSKNDTISLNGLGERFTTCSTTTTNY